MKSGLFAFILLSALVHAVVLSFQDNWIFNISDKHEQGRSSLNIDLFAKPTKAVINQPTSNAAVAPKITKEKPIRLNKAAATSTQHIALLNSVSNTPHQTTSQTPLKNKKADIENNSINRNNNTEKIKTLLNNELSKHFYYPKSARRKNHQGAVLLAFSINSQGAIENISINKSSGFTALDEAAIKALKKINAREELAKALNENHAKHTLPVIYKLTRH